MFLAERCLSPGTKNLLGKSTEGGFVFQDQNLPPSSAHRADNSAALVG